MIFKAHKTTLLATIMMERRLEQASPSDEISQANKSTPDTSPREFDVLCGKDKHLSQRTGNQIYREMIETWAKPYQQADTKQDKMRITKQIVDTMHKQFDARFLKQAPNGEWEEITNQAARDKTSHALRFAAKQQTVAIEQDTHVKQAIQRAQRRARQLQPKKKSGSAEESGKQSDESDHKVAACLPCQLPNNSIVGGVESLFERQQAILKGNVEHNYSSNPHHKEEEEEETPPLPEPEFNTLRSEDLNAIMNEPLHLDSEYDDIFLDRL